MRKDNNKEYNTPESDLKNFKDFDNDKKGLEQEERNFLQNPDGYDLPNKKKLRFNKVTKTWQDVSKDEVKDKIKQLEKIKIKSFDDVMKESDNNIEYFLTNLEKYISKEMNILEEKILPKINEPKKKNTLKELQLNLTDVLDLLKDRNINYKKSE